MGLLSMRKGCWSPEAPHLAAVKAVGQRCRPKHLQSSGGIVPRWAARRLCLVWGHLKGQDFKTLLRGGWGRREEVTKTLALLSWNKEHGLPKFKPENNSTSLKPRTQDFSCNPVLFAQLEASES